MQRPMKHWKSLRMQSEVITSLIARIYTLNLTSFSIALLRSTNPSPFCQFVRPDIQKKGENMTVPGSWRVFRTNVSTRASCNSKNCTPGSARNEPHIQQDLWRRSCHWQRCNRVWKACLFPGKVFHRNPPRLRRIYNPKHHRKLALCWCMSNCNVISEIWTSIDLHRSSYSRHWKWKMSQLLSARVPLRHPK